MRDASVRTTVLDCVRSAHFARGHVPDALWLSRAHVCNAAMLPFRDGGAGEVLVVTCADGTAAEFVAADLADAIEEWPDPSREKPRVFALVGGTAAWEAAGLELQTGDDRGRALLHAPRDKAYLAYTDPAASREDMQAYLDWEFELCAKVRRDGDAPWIDAEHAEKRAKNK